MRKRVIALTVVAWMIWTLGSVLPAHALYCAEPFDTACNTVFGTYCTVTHQSPCHP